MDTMDKDTKTNPQTDHISTETEPSSRREFLVQSAKATAGVGIAALLGDLGHWALSYAADKEPIKIGVLHSLSGTMAISEVSLRDVVLMAVEEINAKGGVMGKKVTPVVVDPASNWDLFAEKAKQLLLQDKVAVVFGCWTSVSRKSVLPVFENNNGLLFYPVQYEGEECSKNVFYTGACPNQQLIPGAEYLMSKEGGSYKEFANQGLRSENAPIMAYSVAEDELRGMDTSALVGHLAAWNYFQSVDTPANTKFVRAFKDYAKKNNLPGGESRVTDDPMEAAYFGVHIWRQAVEKAKSFEVDKVRAAVYGQTFAAPVGTIKMHEFNQHTYRPVLIGEILKNGQFKIISRTKGNVEPEPWSKYTSPDKGCDWIKHQGTYQKKA